VCDLQWCVSEEGRPTLYAINKMPLILLLLLLLVQRGAAVHYCSVVKSEREIENNYAYAMVIVLLLWQPIAHARSGSKKQKRCVSRRSCP
jgi:hypothetical protein